MDQRLTLVTLGVADVARSRAFYEALGWKASSASQDSVAFFQLVGMALALWGRQDLAADAAVPNSAPGFSGIALAFNARSEAEVDAVLADAAQAGGRLVRPAHKTFWGGYSGYFADPDGHLWEVAHNPFWRLDEQGALHLPA
jgi:catechol 2,3-dioxygenase-like lactoylglutathione lyase family enzyme